MASPQVLPITKTPYNSNALASETNTGAILGDVDARIAAIEAATNVPASVALTNGVATTLLTTALASGKLIGGFIDYVVEVVDSTPHLQCVKGRIQFAAVNVAGTITVVLQAPQQVGANPSGTLDVSFSTTSTATVFTIKVNANSNLGAITSITAKIVNLSIS